MKQLEMFRDRHADDLGLIKRYFPSALDYLQWQILYECSLVIDKFSLEEKVKTLAERAGYSPWLAWALLSADRSKYLMDEEYETIRDV